MESPIESTTDPISRSPWKRKVVSGASGPHVNDLFSVLETKNSTPRWLALLKEIIRLAPQPPTMSCLSGSESAGQKNRQSNKFVSTKTMILRNLVRLSLTRNEQMLSPMILVCTLGIGVCLAKLTGCNQGPSTKRATTFSRCASASASTTYGGVRALNKLV